MTESCSHVVSRDDGWAVKSREVPHRQLRRGTGGPCRRKQVRPWRMTFTDDRGSGDVVDDSSGRDQELEQ